MTVFEILHVSALVVGGAAIAWAYISCGGTATDRPQRVTVIAIALAIAIGPGLGRVIDRFL